MKAPRQVCSFRCQGETFGIDVAQVQEVLLSVELTPLPRAMPAVRGLISLRGEVVTALDLGMRLGLGAAGPKPACLIVRGAEGPLSLLIDGVGEVLEPSAEEWEEAPETLQGHVRAASLGVAKLKAGLLIALDLEKIVDLGAAAAAA